MMIQGKNIAITLIISAALIIASASAVAEPAQILNRTNDKDAVQKLQSTPVPSTPAGISPNNPAMVNPSDPTGVNSNIPSGSKPNIPSTGNSIPPSGMNR